MRYGRVCEAFGWEMGFWDRARETRDIYTYTRTRVLCCVAKKGFRISDFRLSAVEIQRRSFTILALFHLITSSFDSRSEI